MIQPNQIEISQNGSVFLTLDGGNLTLPSQCINKIDGWYVADVAGFLADVLTGDCSFPYILTAPTRVFTPESLRRVQLASGGFKVVFSIPETQHWIQCKTHLIQSPNQSPIECGWKGTALERIVLDSFTGPSFRLLPALHFLGHGCCFLPYL
jgi:hypothetical protein